MESVVTCLTLNDSFFVAIIEAHGAFEDVKCLYSGTEVASLRSTEVNPVIVLLMANQSRKSLLLYYSHEHEQVCLLFSLLQCSSSGTLSSRVRPFHPLQFSEAM